MLKKENRLTKAEFSQASKLAGFSFSKNIFSGKISNSKEDSAVPHFAIVIAKKVAKNATSRNKIRRIFYETIRLNLDKIKPNTIGQFYAKNLAKDSTKEDMEKEILTILKETKVF